MSTAGGLNVPLLGLTLALVTGGYLLFAMRGGTAREVARQDADDVWRATCAVDDDTCASRLAASGEACFRASYAPSGHRSKSGLDVTRFITCVDAGHETWSKAWGESQAAARRDEAKLRSGAVE